MVSQTLSLVLERCGVNEYGISHYFRSLEHQYQILTIPAASGLEFTTLLRELRCCDSVEDIPGRIHTIGMDSNMVPREPLPPPTPSVVNFAIVSALCTEALRIDFIGPDEALRDLGADSLTFVELCYSLSEVFDDPETPRSIPLEMQLLSCNTVTQFVATLST